VLRQTDRRTEREKHRHAVARINACGGKDYVKGVGDCNIPRNEVHCALSARQTNVGRWAVSALSYDRCDVRTATRRSICVEASNNSHRRLASSAARADTGQSLNNNVSTNALQCTAYLRSLAAECSAVQCTRKTDTWIEQNNTSSYHWLAVVMYWSLFCGTSKHDGPKTTFLSRFSTLTLI